MISLYEAMIFSLFTIVTVITICLTFGKKILTTFLFDKISEYVVSQSKSESSSSSCLIELICLSNGAVHMVSTAEIAVGCQMSLLQSNNTLQQFKIHTPSQAFVLYHMKIFLTSGFKSSMYRYQVA